MKRVKAGALYYAIFISFFIALISGFMILQHWYQRYYVMYVQQGERLERNIQSALLVVMQNPDELIENEKKKVDLFDDSLDIVEITKSWWGGYHLLRADANWRVINKSTITLTGTETLPHDVTALYLAEDGKYLSMAGNTLIRGNCYLPKLGVRKAYIEGTGFSGDKLIEGSVKESKESLPITDTMFVYYNRLTNQSKISENDSIMDVALLLNSKSLINSFYNKTIKVNTSSWLTLENLELRGNIKITSGNGITIKKTSAIQDVIFYAPKIEIEEGFSGSLQCFVTDTLLIGEDCTLKYPSLLALNETNIERPIIKVGENVLLLGDIVILALSSQTNVLPECSLEKEVVVNGTVFCSGKINLKGTIKGQLFCKGFLLRTNSSIYENHILNATLNSKLLSPYYAGSMYCTFGKLQKPVRCME